MLLLFFLLKADYCWLVKIKAGDDIQPGSSHESPCRLVLALIYICIQALHMTRPTQATHTFFKSIYWTVNSVKCLSWECKKQQEPTSLFFLRNSGAALEKRRQKIRSSLSSKNKQSRISKKCLNFQTLHLLHVPLYMHTSWITVKMTTNTSLMSFSSLAVMP